MADKRGGVTPLNLGINKRSQPNALSQQIGELLRSLGGVKFGSMGRGSVGLPISQGTHGFDHSLSNVLVDLVPTILRPTQDATNERQINVAAEQDDRSVSKPMDAQLFYIDGDSEVTFTFANFTNMSTVIMRGIPHKLGRPPLGYITLAPAFRTIVSTTSTEFFNLFRHVIPKQMDHDRSGTVNYAGNSEFYVAMDFIPSRTAATGVVPFPQLFTRLKGSFILF